MNGVLNWAGRGQVSCAVVAHCIANRSMDACAMHDTAYCVRKKIANDCFCHEQPHSPLGPNMPFDPADVALDRGVDGAGARPCATCRVLQSQFCGITHCAMPASRASASCTGICSSGLAVAAGRNGRSRFQCGTAPGCRHWPELDRTARDSLGMLGIRALGGDMRVFLGIAHRALFDDPK
jgi:hypothetical protein